MKADQPSREPQRRQHIERFFALNIRAKIILPYLILTLVVAVIGTYVVTSLVASSLDERLTNQLLEAGRVVSDSLARHEVAHLESARVVAFTRGLAEALQAHDRESVIKLAQPAAAGLGIELLVVADADGHDVVQVLKKPDGTYQAGASPFDSARLWMVPALLQSGDPNALPKRGIGQHPANRRYYYFTAIPVGLENRVVGVVIVGTSLDTLLPYFKATSVADVIIYSDGGRAVGATFAFPGDLADTADLLDELSIAPDLYQERLNNTDSTLGENIRIRGRWYRLARGPLRVGRDRLGVLAVALPSNFIISAGATSRNTYSLLFTAAMACVILIGYLIARRITGPLGRLVNTSQAVAEGDLEQRTGISSTDEIGALATTFDTMTGRLADRTRALEELLQDYKETASRLKAILFSIGDGVVLGDPRGDFITLNAAAEALLSEMEAAYLLSPLMEISEQASDPSRNAQPHPWLPDHRRLQVGKKVISAHSAAVRSDDGQDLGTVIVLRDVTAEVAAEQLKDAFVTHVSHELRTPLTAIKGYSALLLTSPNGTLDEQQRSFLETICHHTDHLIEMINGLLDFSEMEAKGYLGVQRRPILISTLVEQIAQDWHPQMEDKGLELQVEIPASLPPINADVRRLRWAITNLVRNAWQYTPAGGQVELRLAEQDGHVILDVADTGIGISPENQRQLFSHFHYQANGSPDDDMRGLGLGLYVTKAIVEAHGGEIRVVSTEGVGSTFSVILPAMRTGRRARDAAHPIAAASK